LNNYSPSQEESEDRKVDEPIAFTEIKPSSSEVITSTSSLEGPQEESKQERISNGAQSDGSDDMPEKSIGQDTELSSVEIKEASNAVSPKQTKDDESDDYEDYDDYLDKLEQVDDDSD
jgi:hypothetical protein